MAGVVRGCPDSTCQSQSKEYRGAQQAIGMPIRVPVLPTDRMTFHKLPDLQTGAARMRLPGLPLPVTGPGPR